MPPADALVALNLWTVQVAIIVVFSVSAVIISLYCLFFMVPVKRFWERIHSLGGGIKGIEEHVRGVREEIAKRLRELERQHEEQVSELGEQARSSTEELRKGDRELRREGDRLRNELQSLQAEVRQAISANAKLTQRADALTTELSQLRNDFEALGAELRESVRHQVADSFMSVESTILSALDAVQDEMLYGVTQPPSSRGPFPARHRSRDSECGEERDNIITMGPLFAGLPPEDEGTGTDDESECEEAEDAESDD